MGLFNFLERQAGDSKIGTDWIGLGRTGAAGYGAGNALTEEGLTGLRSLDSTYQGQLSNPLGVAGNQLFARARGQISDAYSRDVNASSARRAALAAQSGGALTAEQINAGNAADARSAGESQFQANTDLAQTEGQMVLTQTNKLYDRMESIRKTILGVGQDERTQGLQTMLNAMLGRTDRMKAIWGDVTSGLKSIG